MSESQSQIVGDEATKLRLLLDEEIPALYRELGAKIAEAQALLATLQGFPLLSQRALFAKALLKSSTYRLCHAGQQDEADTVSIAISICSELKAAAKPMQKKELRNLITPLSQTSTHNFLGRELAVLKEAGLIQRVASGQSTFELTDSGRKLLEQ